MVGDMMARQQAYQQEMACQAGTPMVPKEVAEAADPAPALMLGYWSTAQTGKAPLASFIVDKNARWTAGATALDQKTLTAIKDPFAQPGNAIDPKPLNVVRAGDGTSAQGQWQVRDGAGKLVGTYNAVLRRRAGTWLLSSLELVDNKTWVDPVVQYCHKPGDVLGYRLTNTKSAAAYAEKRLAKAQKKEAEARTKAEKAKAEAEAEPDLDTTTKQGAARLAGEKLASAVQTTAERQAEADRTRTAQAKAEADQKALDDQRAAGKAALAGTPSGQERK
jgi:hypothetical protein